MISAPLDFLGINYYTPSVVRDAPYRDADPFSRMADDNRFDGVGMPEARHTAMDWPVAPHTQHELLVGPRERYGNALPPVHITENGSAEHDVLTSDGAVHDAERISYLDGHLRSVAAAIADGVDVRGYYVWSLLDNFEWAYGYSKRFGLVYVDYATQRRVPKDSFHWYRALIAAQS